MVISQSFEYEEVTGFKFGYQPIGKPNMFSHIYYVDGLLIDTGHSKMRNVISTTTRKLEVEQLYLTHFHEDHTGNILQIKNQHHCPVYAPSKCCEIMKDPPKLSLAQKLLWGDREAAHDLIPKDDVIKTRNFHFDLLPIPGHAPDMVALYEPDRKWLFSADLYLHSYIGYFLRDESILDQIESTKKILKLDFDVMFCSHNPQLKLGKQKLSDKLRFLESFFNNVSALHKKGHAAREIIKHLKLKETWSIRLMSGGDLSKLNMVKSVIRDLERADA